MTLTLGPRPVKRKRRRILCHIRCHTSRMSTLRLARSYLLSGSGGGPPYCFIGNGVTATMRSVVLEYVE